MSNRFEKVLKSFSSVFDLNGRPLTKRHSAEENLHATWHNVGVYLTRGMERAAGDKEVEASRTSRKSRYF